MPARCGPDIGFDVLSTIASLVVNLGMQSAKFDGGARKARVSLASLAQGTMALNAAVQLTQTAFRGFEFVFDKLHTAAKDMDGINDLSNKSGFSTEGIVGLQHAAKMSGVEVESLNSSLGKMNAVLGKAAHGGESAKAIERLGLNVKSLIALEPDKAFSEIAERISQLPTPAEKAAAAVAVFGKSGGELINVLSLGSSGLAEMRLEAERLGLTFSNLDGAKLGAAFDTFDKIGGMFEGLKRQTVARHSGTLLAGAFQQKAILEEFLNGNFLFGITNGLSRANADFAANLAGVMGDATKKKQQLADVSDDLEDSLANENKQLKAMQGLYDSLYSRESARFALIESGLTALEQYEQKQSEIADMLKQLDKDRHGYSSPLIDQESYDFQKAQLERQLEQNRTDEGKRQEGEAAGRYGSTIAALMNPAAKLAEALAEIDKRTDPIFGGPGSDFLNAEQSRFAKLQAQKTYLESLPDPDIDRGPQRAGALERGSAAAFSASFGSKAIDKTQTEMLRVEREIRDILKRNSTQVVTIGA